MTPRPGRQVIVLVVNGLVLAGAEGQVVRLAEHLRRVGHDVIIATLFTPEAHQERLAAAGVEVVVLGSNPLGAVAGLTRLLRRRRANVVCSFLYQSNLVALAAGTLARTPRRVTSIRNERFGGPGRELLLRLFLLLGHSEVTNSTLVARRLLARRVLLPGRVVVVPNAVDGGVLGSHARARASVRTELGVGTSFTWISVARLKMEQKGLDVLLRAFATQPAGPAGPPRLVLVGDGPDRAALETLADALGCGSRVHFLGRRHDVASLLAAADGFALASRWEGSPNVILEALAANLPVVATAVGGVAELLGDEVGLVPPGDTDALAAAMATMAGCSAERRAAAMSQAKGRLARHDPTVVGAAWERVLTPSSRVALFMQSFSGGGAQRVFLTVAGLLPGRGVGVDLVVARSAGPLAAEVPAAAQLVDLGDRRTFSAIPGLVRYLRMSRPAALLTTLDHATVVGVLAVALARTQTPIVVRVANTTSVLAERARGRDRIVYLAARYAFRRATALIAPSAGAARDLEQWLGLASGAVSVVPNPVVGADLDAGRLAPVSHPWFGCGHGPVLLAVCRLERQKGLMSLLAAFAEVRRTVSCRLLVLGEGSQRQHLEARVVELGLTDFVDLPGFDPNPYRYLARAGAFVLASEVEGLPGALIQALACGCPVVATDCPSGPREILDSGRYGKLVPVGDTKALGEALIEVLRAGRVSPDPASFTPYTWEQSTAAYLHVLGRVGVTVPSPLDRKERFDEVAGNRSGGVRRIPRGPSAAG